MDDTIEKTILITGVEQKTFDSGNTKVTLFEDKRKYDIWKKKKDGTDSVAWTQFNERTPRIGESLPIIFKEFDDEYKGTKFKRRTIVYLPHEEEEEKRIPEELEEKPVEAENEPKEKIGKTIVEVVKDHETRIRALEDFVKD